MHRYKLEDRDRFINVVQGIQHNYSRHTPPTVFVASDMLEAKQYFASKMPKGTVVYDDAKAVHSDHKEHTFQDIKKIWNIFSTLVNAESLVFGLSGLSQSALVWLYFIHNILSIKPDFLGLEIKSEPHIFCLSKLRKESPCNTSVQ